MVYEIDREMCIVAVSLLLLTKIWQSGRCFSAYQKSQRQNKIYLALSIMFLFLFFGRFVYVLKDFYLPGYVPALTVTLWGKLGGLLDALGVGVLFLLIEIQQFHGKDKYAFLMGYIFFVILYAVTLDPSTAQFFMFFAQCFNIFLVYTLLSLILKSKGEARSRGLKILTGWALFIVGTLITNDVPVLTIATAFGVSIYVVDIVAYAIKIVGVVVLANGYL